MLKRIFATSNASTLALPDYSTPKLAAALPLKLSSGEIHTPKPGCLIAVTRAISARVNQNFDGFPSNELKKAYRTFVGRPVFVNHNNDDEKRTRGQIIDAVYKEAGNDKYVELTIEIDAVNFPKLASKISTGELDSVSMGCDVKFTKCSYCDNIAHDVDEFCKHVKYQKGQTLEKFNEKTGRKEDVLIYESCHGLNFFEISYVFDPADETAINQKVYLPKKASVNKQALGELTSPPHVETLADNEPCPICGDDNFDGKECRFCEYVTPPKELQDPDTAKANVLLKVRHDPNAQNGIGNHNAKRKEGNMAATSLQQALARRRLMEAQRRLAQEDPANPETTDVTEIDSNPATFEEAKTPEDTADVTKLEPSAGAKSSRKHQADFPQDQDEDPSQGQAPAGPPAPEAAPAPDAAPAPEAAPPAGPEGQDESQSIDSLPIEWKSDESGQPYGSVEGTGLDIFVNEDMTWQVLPEGSDQPVQSGGPSATYEDAVQEAFQAAQSGGQGDPSQDPTQAPVDPSQAPAQEDPSKFASRKVAEGVPASADATDANKEDVTKLDDYETLEDGGKGFSGSEFAQSAGDSVRKLDDSSTGFAPGGGEFTPARQASLRVTAAKAMELVEIYADFGIIPNDRKARFAAMAKVGEMSRANVELLINFAEAIEKGKSRIASAPRSAVPVLKGASVSRIPSITRSASKPSSSDVDTLIFV